MYDRGRTLQGEGSTVDRVGGYRVVRRLATGGTSDVLLAKAEGPHGFERTVVLKLLLSQFQSDPDFSRMFAHEAAAYARLSHPSIVRLFDFFESERRLVMVLEFVDGPPLHRLRGMLRAVGQHLDDASAIFVATRIFDALAAAHANVDETGAPAPVIHRDINPSNVLVPWDGHVKLADFGVAKVTGLHHESVVGMIKGTFGYMAPEQVTGEPVTPRADVYAAGVILWELLARRRAFQRGALPEVEVLRAMAEPKITSLDVLRPDLDKALRDAVRRALEPRSDRRTLTAEEMVSVLRACVSSDHGREGLCAMLDRVRHEPKPVPTMPPPAADTTGPIRGAPGWTPSAPPADAGRAATPSAPAVPRATPSGVSAIAQDRTLAMPARPMPPRASVGSVPKTTAGYGADVPRPAAGVPRGRTPSAPKVPTATAKMGHSPAPPAAKTGRSPSGERSAVDSAPHPRPAIRESDRRLAMAPGMGISEAIDDILGEAPDVSQRLKETQKNRKATAEALAQVEEITNPIGRIPASPAPLTGVGHRQAEATTLMSPGGSAGSAGSSVRAPSRAPTDGGAGEPIGASARDSQSEAATVVPPPSGVDAEELGPLPAPAGVPRSDRTLALPRPSTVPFAQAAGSSAHTAPTPAASFPQSFPQIERTLAMNVNQAFSASGLPPPLPPSEPPEPRAARSAPPPFAGASERPDPRAGQTATAPMPAVPYPPSHDPPVAESGRTRPSMIPTPSVPMQPQPLPVSRPPMPSSAPAVVHGAEVGAPPPSRRGRVGLVVALVVGLGVAGVFGTFGYVHWQRAQLASHASRAATPSSPRATSSAIVTAAPGASPGAAGSAVAVAMTATPSVAPTGSGALDIDAGAAGAAMPVVATSATNGADASAAAVASAAVPTPAPTAAAVPASAPSTPAADGGAAGDEMGTITTTGAAPHRRIFVDEKVVGQTPETVRVKCGARVVRLGSSGSRQSIDVPCGGEITVGDK